MRTGEAYVFRAVNLSEFVGDGSEMYSGRFNEHVIELFFYSFLSSNSFSNILLFMRIYILYLSFQQFLII